MMNKRAFMLSLFYSFFVSLTGCATSPTFHYKDTQTILVIPKQAENTTREKWILKYDIEISQGGQVVRRVPIKLSSDGPTIVYGLEPGAYQVEKYQSRFSSRKYRPAGTASKVKHYDVLPIEFELSIGFVTILDAKFYAEQDDRGGFVYFNSALRTLFKEEREEVIASLPFDQSKWKIMDASHQLKSRDEAEALAQQDESDALQYIESLNLSEIKESDWTDWKSEKAFENEIDEMDAKQHYPIAIEGQYADGEHRYRTIFAPYPDGDFFWAANWANRKKTYLFDNAKNIAQGYQRIWLQDYEYYDRYLLYNQTVYQAVWIKLNDKRQE